MKGNRSVIGVLFLCMLGVLSCACNNNPQEGDAKNITPITNNQKGVEYKGYDRSYSLYDKDSSLRSKVFYFCVALEKSQLVTLLEANDICKAIRKRYDQVFKDAKSEANLDVRALGKRLIMTPEEVAQVGEVLVSLAGYESFKKLLDMEVRPSGKYERYAHLSNDMLVRAIWTQSVAPGINTIIEQYLIGAKPLYPKIDGPKYGVTSVEYSILVKNILEDTLDTTAQWPLFYSKLLSFAINILSLNERDEAVRFEPLGDGENREALGCLNDVDWSRYKYSSLLVLGDSPNSPGDDIRLSEGGKMRVGYAIEAFNRGLAPVIILSGANVYPFQTPYFEALEMKRWLMETYSIDEKCIIVEPMARHTTTNLRNASRLIFKYGIPIDKKGIIVTTKSQNDRIASGDFETRCVKELGYMPVKLGERLSDCWLEYTPSIVSMSVNTLDPLDP